MITVSLEGLFPPALDRGLSEAQRADLSSEVLRTHQELMARRGQDVGFYDAPGDEANLEAILVEAKRLRSLADDLLVIGIGGSSLGGRTLCYALRGMTDRDVHVHFLDNIDPDSTCTLLNRLQPQRTAAIVIAKHGAIETLSHLLITRRWLKAALGPGEMRSRLVFITDPDTGMLRETAQKEGIRAFDIPKNIGGRFSGLTAVGLLPAAFRGIDIKAVAKGASDMAEACAQTPDLTTGVNPAAMFAAGAVLAQQHLGCNSLVFMPYAASLRWANQWFVQLWAESLGKRLDLQQKEVNCGQTPIAAMGTTDQHSQLQLFVEGPKDKLVALVAVEKWHNSVPIPDELPEEDAVSFLHGRDLADLYTAERRATRAGLLEAGVPVMDVLLPQVDAESVGQLLMLLEAACAQAGLLMGINPFDQPGVEASKRMTFGLMGRTGFEQEAERVLSVERRSESHTASV